MKPEDKAAFEEWWTTANARLTDIAKSQAVYIYESMLAHRDKQAAQAEPVVFRFTRPDGSAYYVDHYNPTQVCIEHGLSLPVALYTEDPAVSHPPAEVVRELVEALDGACRYIDGFGGNSSKYSSVLKLFKTQQSAPAQPVQPAGAQEPIQCPNCHFFHATTGTHEANPAAAINQQMLDVLNEIQRDLTILLGNIFASSKRDKNWEGMYDIVNGWITRNHKAIAAAEAAKGGV